MCRALRCAPVLLALMLASCTARTVPERAAPAPDTTSFPSDFATPGAALQAAGATRAFLVRPDGDLTNGAWRVVFTTRAGDAEAAKPERISAEDRWLPVMHWSRVARGVRFEFEAVATPEMAANDSMLFVSVRVCARNTGASPAEATLAASFAPLEPGPPFVATDADRALTLPAWSAEPGGRPVAGDASPRAKGGAPQFAWTLGPGEARVVEFTLGAYALPAREFERRAPRSHEALAAESRRSWRERTDRGARFELGDAECEAALRAATVILLSSRERRGPAWLPTGGPFHYRDVWLRDGARAAVALAVLGYAPESRALVGAFDRYQWPNGAIVSQRGQLDGTGQALWAMAQVGLRSTADSSLARWAVLANRAVDWYATQREMGGTVGEPFARLLPVTDARDNEMVFGQLVGNDAWAIAGLRSAAELLHAAGRDTDAARAEALRAAWQAEFESALARTRHADLPASWQEGGRDWGNLAVGWPCAALPPAHPRLHALADRWWRAGGGPGLGWYATPDTRHGYVGADLATWAMLAGRPADALAVLNAHLEARDGTGGSAETFARATRDFGRNLPPHPTSAAALVAMIRNAVVYDDEPDTLRLTMAPRDAWWHRSRVSRAPTRWGALDLAFASTDGRANWDWTPVPVWTRLTLPVGTRLAEAPAAPLVGFAGAKSLLAPAGTRHVTVAITREATR